ncbi:MAG: SDR family NAD(P)-dependent oxidoreductase [Legionella sp.]|nr:SDR family NAD(P)-dependent oxidoreductase [Legionella sp.]
MYRIVDSRAITLRGTIVKNPKTVLITGATGSIGSALALIYAAQGQTLILLGRKQSVLNNVAAQCEQKGARVISYASDIQNNQAVMDWLKLISQTELLDLVIVNAGVNTHVKSDGSPEEWPEVETLVKTNILAAMATVHGVLPVMRRRKKGQIALISSLAAYYGLPITPTYSASKAAIKAYGEGLRGWLCHDGIEVNVIMPGYVTSPMCDDMPGPKPFLWTAERAARLIQKKLTRNKPRISFPFPLNVGTWWLAVLPPSVSQCIVRFLNYRT